LIIGALQVFYISDKLEMTTTKRRCSSQIMPKSWTFDPIKFMGAIGQMSE